MRVSIRALRRAAAGVLVCVVAARAAPAQAHGPEDAFYTVLHGDPVRVDAAALVGAPGRYVGQAVQTRGRLRALDLKAFRFELHAGGSPVRLSFEPEAQAVLVAHAASWEGRTVEVDGLFYRDVDGPAGRAFALRAWRVRSLHPPLRPQDRQASDAETVSLEDLVYAGGRYDSRLVRVRGTYRGPNSHRDLPETSRRGRGDWVIKDGYFAAWVTGRQARGRTWDLGQAAPSDAAAVVEVVGIPTTAGGVVRIAARGVELSLEPPGSASGPALSTPRAAGAALTSPIVSFAYPVEGETLRADGGMILQFSKPLDPASLASRVRVRYVRGGIAAAAPRVVHRYRDRNRALVVVPEPPPPARTEVVLELLEGIIDVHGRALQPADGPRAEDQEGPDVVFRARFRSAP